jgi:hypothetical protein
MERSEQNINYEQALQWNTCKTCTSWLNAWIDMKTEKAINQL